MSSDMVHATATSNTRAARSIMLRGRKPIASEVHVNAGDFVESAAIGPGRHYRGACRIRGNRYLATGKIFRGATGSTPFRERAPARRYAR